LRLEDKIGSIEIGSIEIGKDANFTILKEYPYKIDKKKIDKIKVMGTVLEGKKN